MTAADVASAETDAKASPAAIVGPGKRPPDSKAKTKAQREENNEAKPAAKDSSVAKDSSAAKLIQGLLSLGAAVSAAKAGEGGAAPGQPAPETPSPRSQFLGSRTQEKLKNLRVLVIGDGSPALDVIRTLSAMGVGTGDRGGGCIVVADTGSPTVRALAAKVESTFRETPIEIVPLTEALSRSRRGDTGTVFDILVTVSSPGCCIPGALDECFLRWVSGGFLRDGTADTGLAVRVDPISLSCKVEVTTNNSVCVSRPPSGGPESERSDGSTVSGLVDMWRIAYAPADLRQCLEFACQALGDLIYVGPALASRCRSDAAFRDTLLGGKAAAEANPHVAVGGALRAAKRALARPNDFDGCVSIARRLQKELFGDRVEVAATAIGPCVEAPPFDWRGGVAAKVDLGLGNVGRKPHSIVLALDYSNVPAAAAATAEREWVLAVGQNQDGAVQWVVEGGALACGCWGGTKVRVEFPGGRPRAVCTLATTWDGKEYCVYVDGTRVQTRPAGDFAFDIRSSATAVCEAPVLTEARCRAKPVRLLAFGRALSSDDMRQVCDQILLRGELRSGEALAEPNGKGDVQSASVPVAAAQCDFVESAAELLMLAHRLEVPGGRPREALAGEGKSLGRAIVKYFPELEKAAGSEEASPDLSPMYARLFNEATTGRDSQRQMHDTRLEQEQKRTACEVRTLCVPVVDDEKDGAVDQVTAAAADATPSPTPLAPIPPIYTLPPGSTCETQDLQIRFLTAAANLRARSYRLGEITPNACAQAIEAMRDATAAPSMTAAGLAAAQICTLCVSAGPATGKRPTGATNEQDSAGPKQRAESPITRRSMVDMAAAEGSRVVL